MLWRCRLGAPGRKMSESEQEMQVQKCAEPDGDGHEQPDAGQEGTDAEELAVRLQPEAEPEFLDGLATDSSSEEEEPLELQVAGKQNFPPTPYEECFDLKMFEVCSPTPTPELLGTLPVPDGSDGGRSGEEPNVSVEQPHHTAHSAIPTADAAAVGSCSGVRRKSETVAGNTGRLTHEEESLSGANGTKKKVRPNGPAKVLHSVVWLDAVASSPTKLHRPLERAWPTRPTYHRPIERPLALNDRRQEDSTGSKRGRLGTEEFSFDIIDTDEHEHQQQTLAAKDAHQQVEKYEQEHGEEEEDEEGEEQEGAVGGVGTPSRRPVTHSDDDASPSTDVENFSVPDAITVALESSPEVTFRPPTVRLHRPLVRTLSNGREWNVVRSPPDQQDAPARISRGSGRQYRPLEVTPFCVPADLVCPPTPTHHARRHCPAAVVSAPPTTNERRSSPSSLDVLTIAVPTVPQQAEESNVAAGVRHVPTMRLPSIPERAWARALLAPESEEPLPPACEARMDNHGRIFYIDHATRSTSWQRPVAHGGVPVGSSQEPDPHRQQLDRRYQSIRRSIYAERRSQLDDSVPTTSFAAGASPETTGHGHPQACGAASLAEQTSSQRTEHPALLMICRSDYYSMLHANGDAIQLYNRNAALKHMVSRVRRDPRCFGRYQHNRDLVALVNCFASSAGPLPTGWETKLDQSGKQFFIDHTNRHTSFMDPRLPTEGPRRVQGAQGDRPVPPPRPPATMLRLASLSIPAADAIPVAYNEKVVAFLRQPNILEILCERHGAAACSRNLREKINAIRVEGTVALDRYSHDLELTILLSLFEDEVMNYVPPRPHSPPINSQPEPSSNGSGGRQPVPRVTSQPVRRDFEAKLFAFHQKLEAKGYGRGPQRLKLVVRRAFVLDDAFQCVMAASKRDLQRGRLCVVWDGEEGLDYGGPSREFFYLLSRRLFNPYHGLYEYSANDIYTVQITPVHHENRRVNYDWYRFSGRVLGLALVHRFLLDAFFTRPFYKALLRSPVALSDLESLDSEFHQSLLWIRDNDVGNGSELGLTFCVTEEPYHRDMPKVELELKPNGRNIIVTERNKRDYLERMIKWRLERGVFAQTEALLRGFYDVVDQRLLSMFDASDLELAISGTVEINARDWRSNTEYRGGYHNGHQVIEWFWIVIDRFTNDQRLRLLQFVTGTSSIPHEGFAGLRGSNGLRRFCVERWDKCDALPRAHTCFNRLDLPPYPTPDILYEKLLMAVEETNTFGIE